MDELTAKVAAFCEKHELLPDDAPLVLMVSGGSDSTALLLVMVELARAGVVDKGRLHVLHVNHGLRGAAADADEAFVACLATRLGVPCERVRVDVGGMARAERGNVEAVGRRERYRAAGALLDRLCDAAGVERGQGRALAAHTRDDRVETFLMRVGVGTGPAGLGSVRPLSGRVARPLLFCSRQGLRDWLGARGEGWREDATNLVPDHDRTYLRLEVLPRLRAARPAFDANLARTMDLAADESDWVQAQANALRSQLERPVPARLAPPPGRGPGSSPSPVALDAAGLVAAPRPLARRVVHDVLVGLAGAQARIGAARVDEVVDGAARDGFSTDLPGFVTVRNASQTLVFSLERPALGWGASGGAGQAGQDQAEQGVWLAVPGKVALSDGRELVARVVEPPTPARLAALDPAREAVVDVGCACRLWVSGPRHGERMVVLGMRRGSKKLYDILADRKVPASWRPCVPTVRLADGQGAQVVWLGGVAVDERCKVKASTARAVHLALTPAKTP